MNIMPVANNKTNNQPSFGRVLYDGNPTAVREYIGKKFGDVALKALDSLEEAHGKNDIFTAIIFCQSKN